MAADSLCVCAHHILPNAHEEGHLLDGLFESMQYQRVVESCRQLMEEILIVREQRVCAVLVRIER